MKKIKPGNVIIQLFLIAFAVIQLFPLYWMITFSLKGNMEIFGGNVLGLPEKWRFDNYGTVFAETNLGRFLLNSIVVTGLTIFFTLLFSAMLTYAVVRLKWRFSKAVYTLFLVGMMIPIHAVLLPLFLNLDPILNSYFSLVLPYTAFAMPLAILIMVGILEGLPRELEEAAFIDGANLYKIFFHLIMPLLTPALSTVAILTFLSSWNELMLAVTFISDNKYKTITTGVMELIGKYSTQWGPVGAGLVIATVPTLILYIALSDNVQKSLAAGAVKG